MDRREFVRTGLLAGIGASVASRTVARAGAPVPSAGPRVIATHPHGLAANREAQRVLDAGGSALDAVERGVMVAEADPDIDSVGLGGAPNAEGVVELDAAVMDGTTLDAGSVAGLRDILHPVSVARRVMEQTSHVLLVGKGARRFALDQGFEKADLLTPAARQRWREWKRSGSPPGVIGHDTIGMIAMDAGGRMAASCTTSGLAWKLPGRVGDSPLIGHGLYCDLEAGGAVATGVGEEIIKVCGSYQVVESMRQGMSPDEAIRGVIRRILRRNPENRERFVGLVAMRSDGEVGFGSTNDRFRVAVFLGGEHELKQAPRIGG